MSSNFANYNQAINLNNNSGDKNPSEKIVQVRPRKKEEEKIQEGPKKVEKPGIKIKLSDKNYINSAEFSDLKLRIGELEKLNEKLKWDKEKIGKELREKDDELRAKVNIIERQKKAELENKKLIAEQQNEIKQLKEQLFKSKNQERSLKSELEKFHGALTEFQGIGNKINEQKQELSKCKKENKELKEKNKIFEKVIQQDETNPNYFIKPAEDYYDVIIDINSINTLKNEGWAIKYNKERKEIYNKIISEETIKIGVLGINNVGKSFLLSKIIQGEIPIGYSIETKGISIKYAIQNETEKNPEKANGICILDSAGFETPLLKEDKKLIKIENKGGKSDPVEDAIKFDEIEDNLSCDKAQTERFIEQLIISLSDMIILVVGKLTRTEQRLITRIKNLSRRNEKNKIRSIIIVHNLAQYHKILEVEKHIDEYLNRSATFKLKERRYIGEGKKFFGRNYLVEDLDESEEIQVFHYIMAKEGTEAGNYFNDFAMELIKNQFNNFNKRRKINIPDEIISLFSELSTEILGEKMECRKSDKDQNVIQLIEKETNKTNRKIIHVQNAYIDQDGNYLKNKDKFEPKYSLHYYKEKNEEEDEYENYLLLRLEIPGNIVRLTARSTNPKTEKFNGIVIKGIKKEDKFKEKSKEDFTTISDNRNYEEFTYFIELNRNLELSKSSATNQTEIYEIQFDKRNKEKYFPKDNLNTISRQNTKNINNNNEEEEEKPNKDDKNIIKIASGVYIMKFLLTERSSIP